MANVLKKLKKLKGRNLDELRVRGRQAFAARAEAYNLSSQTRLPGDAALRKMIDETRIKTAPQSSAAKQHLPGKSGASIFEEQLLDHFRARTSPKFFCAFDNPNAVIEALRELAPHLEQTVTNRAKRIADGRFDLLGARDLDFGKEIDWHLEPVSGKRAPLNHWSKIDYLSAQVAGDKKFTWELNRHQYFATLGKAYLYTGDELYAQTFARHIESWMKRNPPKQGINWASSLEVAFRSISWLWALHFFKDSPSLTPALFARILKYLFVHARHLETYLSTYFSPNTHLTGEALGLFYLGTLLPEFKQAARWRATGRKVLLAELARHVQPDGVYFEQASYYHRYTTDFYTHFLILAQANDDVPVEETVKEKLSALLDHLMYITRPDGTTPFFGDDDGGRLVMLDERAAIDFRATLSNAAVLFRRADYKFVAGEFAEETLWLFGARAQKVFDQLEARPPAETSRAFASGGYYVMRDGWTKESNYMLLDCGAHGALNCGHAHADALAFDLTARGRTALVDPGTFTYTGDLAARDLFRSAAAHNTLTIDDESSSVPGGAFSWKHIAESTPRRWIKQQRFDFFAGAHNGYARLDAPATHTREVLFLKNDYWIMRDRVDTKGAHRYRLNFHFAPDLSTSVEASENFVDAVSKVKNVGMYLSARGKEQSDAANLEIFAFDKNGEWSLEESFVSQCYGARSKASVGVFSSAAKGTYEAMTFLVPHMGASQIQRMRFREVEAKGGRAFESESDEQRDRVLFARENMVEAANFQSDFEWAWMRACKNESIPFEWVLIGGQQISFEGRTLFAATTRIQYASMSFGKQTLRIETDFDGEFELRAPFNTKAVLVNGETFSVNGAAAILRFRRGQFVEVASEEVREEELFA